MGTCLGRCFSIEDSKKPYRSQRSMYNHREDNVEFDFLVDDVKTPVQETKRFRGISYLLSLRRKKPCQEVTLELTDDTWSRADRNPRLQASLSTRIHEDGMSLSSTPWFVESASHSAHHFPEQQNTVRGNITELQKHGIASRFKSSEVDSQLQSLDARSLLATRALHQLATTRERSITSSTPPSSLDLEWEHEGGVPIQTLPEEDRCESSATNGQNGASSAGWSRISTPDSLEWDPVEAPLASMAENPGELDAETEQLLSEIERLTSRALRETGDWSS